MKYSIIHFSDIHIDSKNDNILNRIALIANAIKAQATDSNRMAIVVSGDIINYGKTTLFDTAYDFLCSIRESICQDWDINVDFIVVPGNHDCDFTKESPYRELSLKDILSKGQIEKDEYATAALSVQDDFFSFANKLSPDLYSESRISIVKNIAVGDKKVIFHCYNSALLSTLEEKPQSLIISQDNYLFRPDDDNSIVISVFHHNTGWLSTHTEDNNRKRFEQHILHHSDIIMCGHEHQSQMEVISDLKDDNHCIYMESDALQNGAKSSFAMITIDLGCSTCDIVNFEWSEIEKIYKATSLPQKSIKTSSTGLTFSDNHEAYLNRIDVPLTHPKKKELSLNDLFVYPDLEDLSVTPILKISSTYYSSRLISGNPRNERIVIIEGEVQSGKTSLLKRFSKDFVREGIYPVWTNGSDWTDARGNTLQSIVKKKYKEQYKTQLFSFDKYFGLERSERAIFIDNFENSTLNAEGKVELLKLLSQHFEVVIITTRPYGSINTLEINNISISKYRLLFLGHKLRYSLVEKWKMIGINAQTVDLESINREIKLAYQLINSLLGNQLMPSSPVFVLSLLQSLDMSKNGVETKDTGYAYCYNTLLMGTLLRNGLPESNLQGFLQFLEYLAYGLYTGNEGNNAELTKEQLESFIQTYKQQFNFKYSVDQVIKLLIDSNLYKEVENLYSFRYKYVYYFLIAKRISKLPSAVRDETIKELCSGIINEQNANILIFLVHHIDDDFLLEQLITTGKSPYPEIEPLTLLPNDSAFAALNNLMLEVKPKNVLYDDVNYKEFQQDELERQDEIERSAKADGEERISPNEITQSQDYIDLIKTSIAIKILGQIVKNQRDTLEKNKLKELIRESYLVGFRALSNLGQKMECGIPELTDFIISQFGYEAGGKKDIEMKLRLHLSSMLYNSCLSVFTQLALCVGTSEINEIFDDIAREINTPAAKVVSFTIKTYYGTMRENELKEIVDEFRNNPVALQIIRARVNHYVYNNYLTYDKKQRIGSICDMQLINRPKV